MFKKRKWSKYEHVMFVEDFRGGIKTYELLIRTDELSEVSSIDRIFRRNTRTSSITRRCTR